MSSPSMTLRLLASQIDDTGGAVTKQLDKSITLAGLVEFTAARRVRVEAADVDVALTFSGSVGVLLVSHDNSFKLRLAAGQKQLSNLRAFVVWAKAATPGADAIDTSVLLSGNGTTPADVEVWIAETPPA